MKIFSNLLDSDSKFRETNDVKKAITTSKNYQNEPYESAKTLNFFQTSKQRSYIVATQQMVYCIVDDVRKQEPKVNWSEKIDSFSNATINTKPKTDRTGLVDFGENHNNWLFSKSLFEDDSVLKTEISKLVSDDT